MLKHILSFGTLLLLVFSLNATAQIDRTTKPVPGPAPEAALPEYKETTLDNGLKVLVVNDNKQPLVRFRLMFKSGSEFDPDGSGEASFTSSLLTKGTTTRSALEFAKESEFLGIGIGAGAADDVMNMSASGLVKHMDKILELMTDALLNPTFPQEELEKERKQTLNGLKSAAKSPEAISGRLQITVGYNDHPYANFTNEETVNSITRDALVEFHKTYFIPNNASLAVIGDITMDEVLPTIKKYFGDWKKGKLPVANFKAPKPINVKGVHLVDLGKTQTQTVIEVMTTGMKRSNPDYIPMGLANSILGGGFSGRLFQNLRETHSFTYGAYSSMDSRKDAGLWTASSSVRRAATDSAIIEIMKEMRRMQTEPVSDEELTMHKDYASGRFLLSLENPGTMASRLQNIDLYSLPKDYYDTYVPKMMKVTAAEIQRVSKKYMTTDNVAITAVGDAGEIKPALERIAPVQMYDIDMNPVDDTPKLDVDMDAETLLKKHIEALGGKDAIAAIKDRTMDGTMSMEAGPQTIEGQVNQVAAYPNKAHQIMVLSFNGQQMTQEEWSNGSVASVSGMGGSKTLDGDDLAKKLEDDQFNEVIRFDELGWTAKVSDKKVEDGRTVYYLDIAKKHATITWLIDAENFMQVGSVKIEKSERGEVVIKSKYSDFKEIDGVKLPHTIAVEAGPTSIGIKVSSYKHNTSPPDSEFTK
jgi:zinc protease